MQQKDLIMVFFFFYIFPMILPICLQIHGKTRVHKRQEDYKEKNQLMHNVCLITYI